MNPSSIELQTVIPLVCLVGSDLVSVPIGSLLLGYAPVQSRSDTNCLTIHGKHWHFPASSVRCRLLTTTETFADRVALAITSANDAMQCQDWKRVQGFLAPLWFGMRVLELTPQAQHLVSAALLAGYTICDPTTVPARIGHRPYRRMITNTVA